ncbi:transcriptional regulator family: Fungal Specific TF [Paecilomyces variotii]|nr:transcriptional regulator family: Fungal Specific TF [Paecilomyces variotii]
MSESLDNPNRRSVGPLRTPPRSNTRLSPRAMNGITKHPLRKSCGFCRARKIKCSNEKICEACRKQQVECIYDVQPVSRAPQNAQIPPQLADHPVAPTHTNADSTSSSASPSRSPGYDNSWTIASELESIFVDNFSPRNGQDNEVTDNPWHQKIGTFYQSVAQSEGNRTPSAQSRRHPDIFSIIVKDLVTLVVSKFGLLGCNPVDNCECHFLVKAFREDHTTTMFDESPPASNPLAEFETRKITQLIDIWFSTHRLSFILSKTLVLYELRRQTLDETLLLTIMGDALILTGEEEQGQRCLRWAANRLWKHPYSKDNTSSETEEPPEAGASLASPPEISIVQTLVLLGWHALCRSQIRRALCHIGLACRLAKKLREYKWSTATTGPGGRINGIEVREVEREIIAYLWWITFIIFQWLFIQMDEKLPYLPRTSLSSVFLPADPVSSALIRLDEASDHISTLHQQKAAMVDIWPVAHVCSIVAYVYDLYPEQAETGADEPSAATMWQEAALSALGRIKGNIKPHGLDIVCREVHQVLIDNVSIMGSKLKHDPSRTFVLTVYHSMAIHLLFPHTRKTGRTAGTSGPNSAVIEDLCFSAKELIKIITSALEPLDVEPLSHVASQLHPFSPDTFTLALDTCCRAMEIVCAGRTSEPQSISPDTWQLYEPQLRSIATNLYELGQIQNFSTGPSCRAVRKQIEAIARQFGVGPPSCGCTTQYQADEDLQGLCSVPVLELNHATASDEQNMTTSMPANYSNLNLSSLSDISMGSQIDPVNDNVMPPADGILSDLGDFQNRPHNSVPSKQLNSQVENLEEWGRNLRYDDDQDVMVFDPLIIDQTWSMLRQGS